MMLRRLATAALILWTCWQGVALAQTPSPLQEWQYSGGIPLEKLFEPNLPTWQVIVGASAATQPAYTGAKAYEVLGGPVFDIRYKDIAFFSAGEGLGVNLLRTDKLLFGVSLRYDFGRHISEDYPHLHGLNDIGASSETEAFASYVLSKKFPLVLRADIRKIMGGAGGLVGDLEGYLPLPGSSQHFVMFAGPSVTFADHSNMQTTFGVTPSQAPLSGYPPFTAHGGTQSWGIGFSATRVFTSHWLVTTEAAYSRLLGPARESPITVSAAQSTVNLSVEYRF
jgi:outer membrane scaffolding protein for murein synthesis (MipA/OmpV family)